MVYFIRVQLLQYIHFLYKNVILHVTVVNKSNFCMQFQLKLSALLLNLYKHEMSI